MRWSLVKSTVVIIYWVYIQVRFYTMYHWSLILIRAKSNIEFMVNEYRFRYTVQIPDTYFTISVRNVAHMWILVFTFHVRWMPNKGIHTVIFLLLIWLIEIEWVWCCYWIPHYGDVVEDETNVSSSSSHSDSFHSLNRHTSRWTHTLSKSQTKQ